MPNILICDDQQVVREGLSAILSTVDDFEVVALASNGEEALSLASSVKPDLILMDLKMPVMNGVQATKKLKQFLPLIPVLVLTTFAQDEWLFDAIRAGAAGYLLKDTSRDDLVKAIRGTLEGQSFIDPSLAGKLFRKVVRSDEPVHSQVPDFDLTGREKEILELIVQGKSNPQIAGELFLATGTVRNYVSVLLSKLKVSDRTQAAVVALRRGIVAPPEDEVPGDNF